jgi:dienelactone hydrolase
MICHTSLRVFAAAAAVFFAALAGPASSDSPLTALDEVPWLSEVTTPVASPTLPQPGRLEPLLVTPAGEAVTTWESWLEHRNSLRFRWLDFLGSMPEPPPLTLTVLKDETTTGIRRQLLQYEAEPGQWVQGWLLRPEQPTKELQAGIVALHPTTSDTIDEIAGVTGRPSRQSGWQLAQRGFVVFCPRCFLWQDAASLDEAVARHRKRHPQSLGMAKMLHDARRAVDVLLAQPDVDPARIGAFGHSLGAKEVLYLAAFDDRIRAAVASEGGLGFRSTNWDAPWYLGEAITDEHFPLNHHQLLALIAPRPFLIVGGESGPGAADGDRSWVLLNAALPVWQLHDPSPRLGLLNHRAGHDIPAGAFERMVEWLTTYAGH